MQSEAKILIDNCRAEIDSESSIAFDPRNENELAELTKVMAIGIISAKIEYAKSIGYNDDADKFSLVKSDIENSDCKQ